MPTITLETLQSRHDFAASKSLVDATLKEAFDDGESLVRFLGRYVSWNGYFGSGVATLAGKIGRSRSLFVDLEEPIAACADRSVHVASFFFDAARDEFDDSATAHRDDHRSLGQATLKGALIHFGLAPRADEILDEPGWLAHVNDRVHRGYGHGTPDDAWSIFRAMGFHLGSEVLADQEFSVIDSTMRERYPELVKRLLSMQVHVAGQDHPAYYWLGIHSGHGGGVEADHFDWAVGGTQKALQYVDPAHRDDLREEALRGFEDFAHLHETFFKKANRG